MAYTLTLTKSERDAFFWIGNRYPHGAEMLNFIWLRGTLTDPDPETVDSMDDPRPFTWTIGEADAWTIRDMITFPEDGDAGEPYLYAWDCFGDDLALKMLKFIDDLI